MHPKCSKFGTIVHLGPKIWEKEKKNLGGLNPCCGSRSAWIRIRMDPELLPGSGSGIIVPDPDPAKSERAYK